MQDIGNMNYYYYSFIRTWHVRTQATEHRQDSTQNIKYKNIQDTKWQSYGGVLDYNII